MKINSLPIDKFLFLSSEQEYLVPNLSLHSAVHLTCRLQLHMARLPTQLVALRIARHSCKVAIEVALEAYPPLIFP